MCLSLALLLSVMTNIFLEDFRVCPGKSAPTASPESLSTLFTSQCGREQEMGPVFPDNVVSDGAEAGPPAQLPNGL